MKHTNIKGLNKIKSSQLARTKNQQKRKNLSAYQIMTKHSYIRRNSIMMLHKSKSKILSFEMSYLFSLHFQAFDNFLYEPKLLKVLNTCYMYSKKTRSTHSYTKLCNPFCFLIVYNQTCSCYILFCFCSIGGHNLYFQQK